MGVERGFEQILGNARGVYVSLRGGWLFRTVLGASRGRHDPGVCAEPSILRDSRIPEAGRRAGWAALPDLGPGISLLGLLEPNPQASRLNDGPSHCAGGRNQIIRRPCSLLGHSKGVLGPAPGASWAAATPPFGLHAASARHPAPSRTKAPAPRASSSQAPLLWCIYKNLYFPR